MNEKEAITKMTNRTYKAILFFSVAFLLLSLNACRTTSGSIGVDWGNEAKHQPPAQPPAKYESKKNGPPAHAPAHGYRAKHHYRYYPDAYVYYDTDRGAYFYLDNGEWRISVSLPSSIHLESAYVSLELDTDEPYRYHDKHKEKYPPGKTKKKNKGKDWAKK